ncbi:glycosyltransferase family 4 protein [Brevibacillus sp. B_LB10_24]|uniref:glycosyltransferase family 4 protein n=1 Tax=Brevibacillus sp. B_LB10_24 TaxID=3380645 RepID=UPI0038B84987
MKVLYIHQYFTTREGSLGTRSYEFAKYLVGQGHQVTMITGDSSLASIPPDRQSRFYSFYSIDGIDVIAVKNHYSNYMGYFRRILSFLQFVFFSSLKGLTLKGYDVVLATSTPLTVAIPALLIKYWNKVPFIFEVRDLWPEAPRQIGAIRSRLLISLLKGLERKTYQQAEHIIALSPGMLQGVLEEGISSRKVTMIPNCCDLDLFGQEDVCRAELREQYQLHGKLVVLHGGSMGIANGLDYLIGAAVKLREQNRDDIVFILAGDGKTRPLLEAMCEQHRLDNVIFTGALPRKKMPELFAAADITITSFQNLPILATNSPNKFFDSLAAGKPVIVNSAGWTKQLVEEYQVGFYVNPDDPGDLADLLIRLQNGMWDLAEMGRRARRLAEEKYERIKLARQVEAVLLAASEQGKGGWQPDEGAKGDCSGGRAGNAVSSGHEGAAQGNAAHSR